MAPETLAAIDLGSNSFHMIVARIVDGQLQVIDRLREMVQLAAGLDKKRRLSEAAQEQALACLARFSQRLRHMPPARVRIVGTNTLRQARNGRDFLAKAEAVLGHPVEVVSGMEEARLIYLGVAHSIADSPGQRLVVDIGGGSTELIIGERFDPLHLESLSMGCVSMTRKCFSEGRIRDTELRAAELAVSLMMEPVTEGFQDRGWDHVIGASGTIKAIRDVVVGEGWSQEGITLAALRQLRAALSKEGKAIAIAERWDLHPARAKVFTGGFAVLHGLCEALAIEHIQVSDGALREGLLYDLMGRIRHEDVRDRTIAALGRRYGLDANHAERVAMTALNLLEQVRLDWDLADEELAHALGWAARLHEVGLAIAHSQHHKHGAYVLRHGDLPGFSRGAQALLSALVLSHRRKFARNAFASLPEDLQLSAQRLCALLRLAVVPHRSRGRQQLPSLNIHVDQERIRLEFPVNWLAERPLTRADLEQEARYLKKAGFRLKFDEA